MTPSPSISFQANSLDTSLVTQEMIEAGLLTKLSLPSIPAADDYIIACSNKAYAKTGPRTFIDWMIDQQALKLD